MRFAMRWQPRSRTFLRAGSACSFIRGETRIDAAPLVGSLMAKELHWDRTIRQ